MSEHLYAYGVVQDAPFELDVDGVAGGERAYTVGHRSLAMVVSDVETMEPPESDENARAHDEVLRAVFEDGHAVVPMRFGMTFESERAARNVLRGGRAAFRRSLRNVEGRAEYGVKLVVDEGATVDREAVAEDVAERLDDVSVSVAPGDLFSDRLVFNRSYLVERDDRAAFDDAVTAVDEAYDDLTIQYSGPWAAYSFVDIEIGAGGSAAAQAGGR